MSSFPSGKFDNFLNTQQNEIKFSIGNLPTQLTWIIKPSIAVLFDRFFSRFSRSFNTRVAKILPELLLVGVHDCLGSPPTGGYQTFV